MEESRRRCIPPADTARHLVVEEALRVFVLELLQQLVDDLPQHRLFAVRDEPLLKRDLVDHHLRVPRIKLMENKQCQNELYSQYEKPRLL